ncbi:hypothetical protein E2C01_019069 [Portunus trituberculatus]|uniref:Uncharacterized protein n=1 Tax=Portunus trituberculatus TaxID=210409 RepID=A0A5B7DXA4_PORTR|nr:hypothetical protein [Portunus trituberculatus]
MIQTFMVGISDLTAMRLPHTVFRKYIPVFFIPSWLTAMRLPHTTR